MRLALPSAVALTIGACVLGDLFGSDGLEPVTLTCECPSGNMSPGSSESFSVTVRVGGAPVRNARISLALVRGDDVVVFNDRKDSLIALTDTGHRGIDADTLLARFESSMWIDTALTLKRAIKVQFPGGQP